MWSFPLADLGFRGGASLEDMYKCALKRGLTLCPNEVGPQLCLQYNTQQIDKDFLIAMNPLEDFCGMRHVFIVKHHYCNPRLTDNYADLGFPFLDVDYRFVFTLPRKSKQ